MPKLKKSLSQYGATSEALVAEVLAPFQKKLADAKRDGTGGEIREAARQLVLAKMVVAENARQNNPNAAMTHMGPGYTALVRNSHELPPDRAVHGI